MAEEVLAAESELEIEAAVDAVLLGGCRMVVGAVVVGTERAEERAEDAWLLIAEALKAVNARLYSSFKHSNTLVCSFCIHK